MNSTKEQIINLLKKEFPLSLTQIFRMTKSEKKVTYQGIRKAVNEMVKDNIIEKLDKQYFLNKLWVKEQTKSFSDAYSNYFNINYNPNQIDNQSSIQVFRFSSLKDTLNFMINAYSKGHLVNKETNTIYISLRRLPPIIPPSLIQFLKTLQKDNKLYIICKSDKLADRWAAKFYRSLGVTVKTGIDIPHQNIACFGDFMLQLFCFYPKQYANKVYSFEKGFKTKSRSSFLRLMDDVFHKKAEIYLIKNRYSLFLEDIKGLIDEEV